MTGQRNIRQLVAIAVAVGAWVMGCHVDERSRPPTPATTTAAPDAAPVPPSAPVAAPGPISIGFDYAKGGIHLAYPPQWRPQPSKDYVLVLVPADHPASWRVIRLDIPDLPPHFPGMIQLGLVERGYLDDLRQQHPDLKLEEAKDTNIQGASARLVHSSWQKSGQEFQDAALLMIHTDRVYILSMETDAEPASQTRQAFDAIAQSLRWTK